MGHTKIVQLLIEKGADVNVKDGDGNTPLQVASEYGYEEIIKLLKEYERT
jgi:ankyrin repeat protein